MLEDVMKKRGSRAETQRQLRVSEQIRHVLAWALEREEIRDPEIQGLIITVTEVQISPDLRNAAVFVLPLGIDNTSKVTNILRTLKKATPFLRKKLASSMHLRKVPQLHFFADETFDVASHIEDLLRRPSVLRDLEKSNQHEKTDGPSK